MLALGQVVYSKNGRDKGKPFIVYKTENNYVYLVDGESRTLLKPKKKKIKHIQMTYHIEVDLQEKIKGQKYLLDSDIRKALVPFSGSVTVSNNESA